MLLYLKTGTGEPCAGQVRAREFNKERDSWSPLDSWENLGAELPTDSRIEEYIQILKRRKACRDGCPKPGLKTCNSMSSPTLFPNLNVGTGMAWAGQVRSKAVLLITTILVRSSVLPNLGAELPMDSAEEKR
jgi:hypothetical protein